MRVIVLAMRLRIRVLQKPRARKPFQVPPLKEGRRSAGRRILVRAAPSGAAARHAFGCCHPPALRARPPIGAPPRARFGESTPPLSSSRASWVSVMGCHPTSPVPVQRAPRRPVIDTGRAVSGAAWERGYEPRPQAPHPPRQLAVTGDVPSWAGRPYVTETVTRVNGNATAFSCPAKAGKGDQPKRVKRAEDGGRGVGRDDALATKVKLRDDTPPPPCFATADASRRRTLRNGGRGPPMPPPPLSRGGWNYPFGTMVAAKAAASSVGNGKTMVEVRSSAMSNSVAR